MNGNGRRGRADKPLLGAVLCCTSVPPEQRTQYAEYAIQMGAEHKLDLTSDVTHLLVGDTNTPKYQYVARERDDIQVLRPEWVEAVRECWMHDEKVNLDQLTKEYSVPTFAGLKICITGFDDLNFRAQLQQKVNDNGGEYTGDLAKDVTHLIANSCEGKKFQYATQWEKKIVGLKWLRDSLERGMQLDETLYHPAKPLSEQGIGAWNRQTKGASQIGKRPRQEQLASEPPRKLRRIASARLGSQNDNVWGDIVGGGGFETAGRDRELLRPSKSLPTMGREKQVCDSFSAEESLGSNAQPQRQSAKPMAGFFAGRSFCIVAFDSRRTQMLATIVSENGGTVYDSLDNLPSANSSRDHQLCLVPHTCSKSSLSQTLDLQSLPNLVTELWVECCMNRKAFVPPIQYPIGGLLDYSPIPDFDTLVVNATGFQGIEVLHVSKMVNVMGARYDEVFKSSTSVLVCESFDSTSQKVLHAQEWGVPVVRTAWLWSCIKACQLRSFDDYLWPGVIRAQSKPKLRENRQQPVVDIREENAKLNQEKNLKEAQRRGEQEPQLSAKDVLNNRRNQDLSEKQKPGSDFFEDDQGINAKPDPTKFERANAHDGDGSNDPRHKDTDAKQMPLKEISTNSPPKSRPPSPQKKKSLFRTFDGHGSVPETEPEEHQVPPAPVDMEPPVPTEIISNAHSINGVIKDLLSKSRAKSNALSRSESSNQKRKLLGRALSNLSNSSIASTARASRASSVDSMNTDGIGSEIAAEPSQATGRTGSSNVGARGSFTGRAKPRVPHGRDDGSIELGELHHAEFYVPEELDAGPQQTQLGYEDSEEALLLRKKLAERRREQSREGQADAELERERGKKESAVAALDKEPKRIRDDDALVGVGGGGWGAGRRTRQKDKSPKGLKDF